MCKHAEYRDIVEDYPFDVESRLQRKQYKRVKYCTEYDIECKDVLNCQILPEDEE